MFRISKWVLRCAHSPRFSALGRLLRRESVAGIILLIAAAAAIIVANSQAGEAYLALRETKIGVDIGGLSLRMSIGHWAADGLLTVFFFLAGLELKQEFVTGSLRHPAKAVLPIAAAVGGVTVPAVSYLLITMAAADQQAGWAIPTATDIAFALAVLAVIGPGLPVAVRTFLLTLAIVDDLIAICIIAVAYTDDLQAGFLLASLVPIAGYGMIAHFAEGWLQRHRWAAWVSLLPIGVLTWILVANSGIHPTITGVLLALTVPVRPGVGQDRMDGLAHRLEHQLRPLSAGLCVPVFAFFSAGVVLDGWDGLRHALISPIAIGIMVGLVVGKTIGIFGVTFALTRFPGIRLDDGLTWIEVLGVSALGGIGFTVSLLLSELSFAQGSSADAQGKVGVLCASLLATALASIILVPRNRLYRRHLDRGVQAS